MLEPRLALLVVLLVFATMALVVYGPAVPRCLLKTLWLRPAQSALGEAFGVRMLGVVERGHFIPLDPERGAAMPVRLTRMPMQAARAPESDEIDLSAFEGRAIVIWGHDGGGWVYSAQVEGAVDPISAALVRWGL